MLKNLRSWWQDTLLRGVLKNSSYLFSSNSLAAGLSMINSIFATRLLGVDGLGLAVPSRLLPRTLTACFPSMSEVVVNSRQALASARMTPKRPPPGQVTRRKQP
jgi:hypothetical protein